MKNDNYNEKYFMESKRSQKIADLEKDRIERYRSQFPRRGFATSWNTIIRQNIKVGDKIPLPTCFGNLTFIVISISNEGIAKLESGSQGAKLVWQDKDEWKYNHMTYMITYDDRLTATTV